MKTTVAAVAVLAVIGSATFAVAGDASTSSPRPDVRLTSDRADVQGCTMLGVVKDDDISDLKKEAARKGGDTALITGAAGADVAFVITFSRVKHVAEVYRCH